MPPQTHSMIAFIKRKEGMSLEDFYHHWETVHGPLVHIGSQTPTGVGADVLGKYDGCAIFEFASPDVIKAAWQDEYFKRDVSPDQELFMQEQVTIMTTGDTVTIC